MRQLNEEFNLTVAGEPITVHLKVHNPSALRLRLTSIQLECSFEPLVRDMSVCLCVREPLVHALDVCVCVCVCVCLSC